MALTACEKDSQPSDGNLHLVVEGMGGSKMAISGNHSYWVTDDKVNINGSEYTLSVSGSASDAVVDVPAAENYYGGYPSDICAVDADLGTCTLAVPAEYTYETVSYNSGTYQHLQSPLVGYAASGADRMIFKHVTAAIGVQVVNYYGFTIEVDSIVVVSDSYKLNGSVAVDLSGSDPTVSATAAVNDAEKKVKMLGGSSLRIFAGDSTVVQIPVLPVGSGNHFTVRTYVHKVDQTAVVKTLEKTQTTGGALARAKIGYARMATPGLFSVSASKKVVISQGNLQYIGSAATPYWKFSETQYGYLGTTTGQNSSDVNKDRDLFGWGTSGWSGSGATAYQPYATSTTDGDYYSTGNISNTNADWGKYNPISNGGGVEGRWQTPTSDEWKYLIESRNVSNRFVKATVAGVKGLIIFSDDYLHPDGLTNLSNVNDASKNFPYTAILNNWVKMEAAGAVFLPAVGYRTSGTTVSTSVGAYYWSSTKVPSESKAYNVYLVAGAITTQNANYSSGFNKGYYVRLVRNVQ